MKISKNFDSGNIRVVSMQSHQDIQLEIESDTNSDFFQWFHFRLHGAQDEKCRMRFLNVNDAAFVEGWEDYQAVASYDREEWFRVPTEYDGNELVVEHTPRFDTVYYAYFAPYSYERHQDLICSAQLSERCKVEHLGESLDGRDLDLLLIGKPAENKRVFWIIARQHPGESMAEWFVEGFLNRLLDEDDPVSKSLLEKAYFYIVPNVNPDGAYRGHLRTNTGGANLNREWQNPSLEHSPEIFFIKKKMQETGVDFFLDVHGDEALPCNFVVTCEGIPSYDERHHNLETKFKQSFLDATPDFQTARGYETDEPGTADLTWGSQSVGETYRCLSMVLEMPFKDNDLLPDDVFGWSPERCMKLAEAIFHPMAQVVDDLR